MPFDPRLIHPDQPPLVPDGELDLPDELAALAQQLTDDAVHLVGRYPADRAPQVALAAELVESAERLARVSRRRRAFFLGASAIGAGLASVAALAISLAWQPNDNVPVVSGLVASTPAAIAPVEAKEAPSPITIPLHSTATLSVGELSGPEMEALLDLLQGEPRSVASISF